MIKCGVDTIEINRLEKLNPAIRERFLQRVFTKRELAQARNRNDILSGLFATKEAVSKTLGSGIGLVNWRDIEILNLPSGEPTLYLHNNAAEIAAEKGLNDWSISISHDRNKAIAIAVATNKFISNHTNQKKSLTFR